jgi:predicted GIY-YIG superfamily endonuclease
MSGNNTQHENEKLKKYCEQANCKKMVIYSQVKTGGNDPSISKKMQYARYVRGPTGKCTKVLDQNGNVVG